MLVIFVAPYDEILDDHEVDHESVDRPLFDSLKVIENDYSDFQPLAQGGMKKIYKVFGNACVDEINSPVHIVVQSSIQGLPPKVLYHEIK